MKSQTIKAIALGLILSLFCSSMFSQEREILPKGLSETEKNIISNFTFRNSRITPPPSGAVRAMAEWEEVEYLVVSWDNGFSGILRQIVAAAVNECKVLITTQNENSVANYLTSGGVDLTNVSFLNAPANSIWIRDYAGNTIYSNDVGERALVDWIYNRPRPDDDVMPTAQANMLNIPLYVTDSGINDLVNTGGNYMSDGLGNAFSSSLVLNENEAGNPYGVTVKTEAQIDEIMENYMGIDNYIKMDALPYDVIHHIDMHMKLLDEETILVSKYPDGVADGPQIEANIQYVLDNHQSVFGTPYDIKWIDAPPSTSGNHPDNGGSYRTYSNSLIINKTILVPTYRPEVDAPALAYYQELMPGYNIVGIDVDNNGENLISLLGAIHCITHTIGVEEPLLIVHQPIDEANANSSVVVEAMIKHISGVEEAKVLWREEGSTMFNEASMSNTGGDSWTANLNTASNDVEYYIWAEANSGKSLTRPMVAPEGYWTMDVGTVLSVNEWSNNHISAPYPNPTRGEVSFDLDNIPGSISISIANVLGQRLLQKNIENGYGTITLDLKSSWTGTLFVTFTGQFGTVSKKIVKL